MVKYHIPLKRKKNYEIGKTEITFFFFLKKEKCIEVRFHVLKHFPIFQRKIFIIVVEKWMKHNYSYDNYLKYHMPLKYFFLIWPKNPFRLFISAPKGIDCNINGIK